MALPEPECGLVISYSYLWRNEYEAGKSEGLIPLRYRRMDRVSKEKRSKIMGRIRGKNTTPELTVRKLVFSLGYRYRLHGKNLPGKPDLVFPGRKKVIFVHGCFWHSHECKIGHLPKSRLHYWQPKLLANRRRDILNISSLVDAGWKVLVIWECETKDLPKLKETICNFLAPSPI